MLGQAEQGLAVVSALRSDHTIQPTLAGPTKDERNSDEHNPRKDRVDHGRQRRDRQGGGPATGSRPEFARIYLACRNRDRATAAKAELEAATGRPIFDIVLMDVTDLDSVRAGVAGIDGSIDALVMNAGVIGPRSMELTADGVTTVFATNVLGHVVLLERLLAEGRLGEVAVLAGSEAARGLPMLGMKRPSFSRPLPMNSPPPSTGDTSQTKRLTSTSPSGSPNTSAPSGWPTWPANTPTAASSP